MIIKARRNADRTAEQALDLGARLLAVRNYAKAVQCHEMIREQIPFDHRVFDGLARSYKGAGNLQSMKLNFQRALISAPDVEAYYFNFANGYRGFDLPAESLTLFGRSKILEPENPHHDVGRGLALLQLGRWREGLHLYQYRESNLKFAVEMNAIGKDIWQGEDLDGKTILLVAEQGLGDTIQCIRYARLLEERGAVVKLRCQEPLRRLLSGVEGVAEISDAKGPDFDYASLIMSMPYLFGTTPETVPVQEAYIPYVNESAIILPESDRLKVGVVWGGSPANSRNIWRSCPFSIFSKLFPTEQVEFYSLQKEWNGEGSSAGVERVTPLSSGVRDFLDTAAVIGQLDLIISVDTSVAHLAGAIGKPVWLLLGHYMDWRWLLDREDTPWYSSMKIFRMAADESWDELIGNVQLRLEQLATGIKRPIR